MDGLINLNKPTGLTSARALDRVRRITGERKSGHAGTLDPMADGVLVLCLGRATKLVETLMDQPKVYRATARLDVTNESFDSERPLRTVEVPQPPDAAQVADACRAFEGTISQVPPAVSALKVRGRPAYALERAGRPPELAPRDVQIYWLFIHRYEWPVLDFEMACGRGTYVRALIRDLGAALHTGGCLTALTRRAVGPLTVEAAWTFERMEQCCPGRTGDRREYLVPFEHALAALAVRPVPIPPRPAR